MQRLLIHQAWRRLWRSGLLRRLHQDQRGAEGIEKLLIILAIVLPLLGLLIVLRDDITEWVKDSFSQVRDDADNYDPSLP
ncbi:MAG TPA: hypothetical protein VF184_02230 [Phycisphaeraceae bacterium]